MTQQLLQQMVRSWAEGQIRPLPLRTFALAEAEAAFRLMARAGHIGKIVLRMAETLERPKGLTFSRKPPTSSPGGWAPWDVSSRPGWSNGVLGFWS